MTNKEDLIERLTDLSLLLKEEGPLTRDEIRDTFPELPRTTIFNDLQRLMFKHLVQSFKIRKIVRGRGRPETYFYWIGDKEGEEQWLNYQISLKKKGIMMTPISND